MKGHDVAWLIVGLLDDVDLARLWPCGGSADEPESRPCAAPGNAESDKNTLTGINELLHLHVCR